MGFCPRYHPWRSPELCQTNIKAQVYQSSQRNYTRSLSQCTPMSWARFAAITFYPLIKKEEEKYLQSQPHGTGGHTHRAGLGAKNGQIWCVVQDNSYFPSIKKVHTCYLPVHENNVTFIQEWFLQVTQRISVRVSWKQHCDKLNVFSGMIRMPQRGGSFCWQDFRLL